MSEDTPTITQKKIEKTLKMDYSTFTASSFILQNEIDHFYKLTPAERKDILFQVLGLDRYEKIQLEVKNDRHMLEKNNRSYLDQIEQHQILINQEAGKQTEVTMAQQKAQEFSAELKKKEKEKN